MELSADVSRTLDMFTLFIITVHNIAYVRENSAEYKNDSWHQSRVSQKKGFYNIFLKIAANQYHIDVITEVLHGP